MSASMQARALRTRRIRATEAGPCWRCGSLDGGLVEVGDSPALEARLCPPCAGAVGAKPAGTACSTAGRAEDGRRCPWEADPAPYPVCRSSEEFRALAVQVLGPARAKVALA